MIYLLDTHVFLWLDAEPEKLSGTVSAILKNRENLLFVSHVSVWEIQVKQQIGKLNLRVPLQELLRQQEQLNQIRLFSIRVEHILNLKALPLHHSDPFEHLLIAQANYEDIGVLTIDPQIVKYPVKVVW
jgi:PIN domain nuclease of toxin-antitoxin system